ncbi:MAG TPA: DUF1015 domain-containing protein [Frankiaceae bacterium]|nr:DUF1015 domain-containing protein [Frankiaceae bacterium]
MSSTRPPVPHGLVLQPFRALRFAAGTDLASLTSPPYDVIDEPERTRLEARSPHNVVRLILPRESDDEAGTGDRYAVAAALLQRWTSEQILIRDPEPALYAYEQSVGGHTSRGLLGGVALARAEDGIILPHENTMAGPVADRLALLRATEADLEPIFLVYAGSGSTASLLSAVVAKPPLVDVELTDPAGSEPTRHRLWPVTDPDLLTALADDLVPRRATIADGHHRYATYLRYQEERHEAGDGAGPWDYGLAFLVDASSYGPEVHAIHRVVAGLPLDEAVSRARQGFSARELGADEQPMAELAEAGRGGTAFVLTDGSRSVLLTEPDRKGVADAVPADRSDAWRSLDVTIAHAYLIRELWQLADREDVVDFAHDVATAVRSAAQHGGTALLLNPTPVEAVAAVAEAGDRMPRKSTLFTPKPATGVVIRPLD